MEKVSIIMPCFNDGEYLRDTFDSIAAQTWKNIEVVVVDDGSTDVQTVQLLKQLEQEKRCQLFVQQRQGPAAARNVAFRHATGAYILPLDADDCIDPTYIEKAVQVLEANPGAGACYCQAAFFGWRQGRWELPDYSLRKMLVDNVVFVSSVMRREAFEQAGGYDESFRTGMEDYDFYLSMLENGWEIIQLPEVLFHYRIKKNSRSQTLVRDANDYHATYRRLYEKHQKLYARHMDTVIPDLRDEMLAKRQENIELQKALLRARHPVKMWVSEHILGRK